MDFTTIKIKVEEHIAVLTINRPQVLNALNTQVFKDIDSFLDSLETRTDVKVLIVTGEGEKAFVAGADIAEMANKTKEEATEFSRFGQKVFARFESLQMPVIAAVNGFALGGGCELTMACDFRIASTKAKFGQPEVNLGLIPGYAGTQRLSRLTGLGNALYLLMTAEAIDAATALRIGLVQEVVEPEKLMERTLELAKKMCAKGTIAIKKVKFVTRDGYACDFFEGCNLEAEVFGFLFAEAEATEGMKAFLEKRKPNF